MRSIRRAVKDHGIAASSRSDALGLPDLEARLQPALARWSGSTRASTIASAISTNHFIRGKAKMKARMGTGAVPVMMALAAGRGHGGYAPSGCVSLVDPGLSSSRRSRRPAVRHDRPAGWLRGSYLGRGFRANAGYFTFNYWEGRTTTSPVTEVSPWHASDNDAVAASLDGQGNRRSAVCRNPAAAGPKNPYSATPSP